MNSNGVVSPKDIDNYVLHLLKRADEDNAVVCTSEYLIEQILRKFFGSEKTKPAALPSVLPFPISAIPSLKRVTQLQERITAKVVCAVATRPVVTVSELEDEICFSEGVQSFQQLHFGISLTCLGVVQQFFRGAAKRTRRLSSQELYSFLLSDSESLKVLASGGDAVDIVQGFAKRIGIPAPQLGLHVQNVPWLLSLLRMEAAKTQDTIDRRLKLAGHTGTAVASLAQHIASSILSKTGELHAVTPTDQWTEIRHLECVVEGVDDIGVLPPKLWSSLSGVRILRIHVGEITNKTDAPAAATVKDAQKTAPPQLNAQLRKPLRRIVQENPTAIDLSDVGLAPAAAGEHVLPVDCVSLSHRITWIESETDVEAVARCVGVLTGCDRSAAMNGSDVGVLLRSCHLGTLLDALQSIDTIKSAIALRGSLRAGNCSALRKYHHALFQASDSPHGEGLGSLLLEAIDADPLSVLVPILWKRNTYYLSVKECLQGFHVPLCVLSGDTSLHLHDFASFLQKHDLSSSIGCIDLCSLLANDAMVTRSMVVVALSGLGFPRVLPLPTQPSSCFVSLLSDALKDTDAARKFTVLEELFFLANDMWHTPHEHSACCDYLRTTKWIPVASADGSNAEKALAAPIELFDPTPRNLRLLSGLVRFVPSVRQSQRPLSASLLSFLGVIGKPSCDTFCQVLSELAIGSVIERDHLLRLYEHLATCSPGDVASAARRVPNIIVIPSHRDASKSFFEVNAVVSSKDVCWDGSVFSDEEQGLFMRNLSVLYPEKLRAFFTDLLGVHCSPHLGCWASSMRSNRTSCRKSSLSMSAFAAIKSLSVKCWRSHLQQPQEIQQSQSSLNVMSMREPLFLTSNGWRCAQDRIIFVGDTLTPTDVLCPRAAGESRRSINFLVLGQRIEAPLMHLLKELGLEDFSEVATCTVTFDSMALRASTEFHQKLSAAVPYVQMHLKRCFPTYYQKVGESIAEALQSLNIVMCVNPFQLWSVTPYRSDELPFHMRKSMLSYFDMKQRTLFAGEAAFDAHVAVESVCEVFCPIFFYDVFESVKKLLQIALRSTDVEREFHIANYKFEGVEIADSECWHIAAPFAEKCRLHYPNGASGYSAPSLRIASGGPASAWFVNVSNGPQLYDSLDFASFEVVLKQVQAAALTSMSRKRFRGDDADVLNQQNETSEHFRFQTSGFAPTVGRRMPNAVSDRNDDPRGYSASAEKFIFEEEKRKYANEPNVVVQWMNESNEQGAPYDIIVLRYSGTETSQQHHGKPPEVVKFIEVKSTCTKNRQDFEMSLREVLFAGKYGHLYHIARVFRATESQMHKMSCTELRDPIGLWQRGQLSMTAEVKVVAV